MNLNAVNREIPPIIDGIGEIKPFAGTQYDSQKPDGKKRSKLVGSLERAIKEVGLKDGMTISFHHHFRNGDYIVNMVMDTIAKLGIKDIRVAASSLTTIHEPLIEHIRKGVITRIETSGLRGRLAEEISKGLMDVPVIIRSHGGRARAIENGELNIDVAFLGVSSCDEYGNANGCHGKSICGSLGYAIVDANYAKKVVLITDNLVEYPNLPVSISQTKVDYVVQVDEVGDPNGIMSGATRLTKNPRELMIAKNTAKFIDACGYLKNGFSMQTGSGGSALAVAQFLRDIMIEKKITASFALGGITQQLVDLHEEGLVGSLFDTQSFDLRSAISIGKNPRHYEIDASYYANPDNKGSVVEKLDFVVLSALEIDLNFNVNVITGSDGIIMGASGGHSDTAAGAKLAIVVAPLIRGRIPTIIDRVNTVITPGETIDAIITDRGIAINPLRKDLLDCVVGSGLPIYTIEDLKEKAEKITGKPKPIEYGEKIVGVVEYRDGTVIDLIRQVK
jgi:citrate lyase subunit alpha/citrate CoA-transferase